MSEIRMKRCNRCGEAKIADLIHFGRHRDCKDCVGPYCRPCRRIQAAESRAKLRGGEPRPRIKPGDRYGRLVALERTSKRRERVRWRFICDCGKVYEGRSNHVRGGAVRSCGCLQTEVAERKGTLGQHGRSEYHIWLGMMQRCHDPRNLSYWRYGGRGISVCDEWRESFTAFLAHVGDRPTPKHSIDRIDGNGNYEPGNVRWATKKEQARNRRSTLFVQWDGEKIPFIELCERQGRKYSYALSRYRGGVPLSRIFEGGASL